SPARQTGSAPSRRRTRRRRTTWRPRFTRRWASRARPSGALRTALRRMIYARISFTTLASKLAVSNWQSGFLPPVYQGTRLRSTGEPILNLRPEVEDPPELVRLGQRLLNRLDQAYQREHRSQPQVDTRIATYELAARMQLEASSAL